MNRTSYNLIATAIAICTALTVSPASAFSIDASFDQAVRGYAASRTHTWHNALLPQASGDYVAATEQESADVAMNRLAQNYRRGESRWINALLPDASGDAVMLVQAESADAKFIRQITYYTRDMLDRGGWINAYAPDFNYAAPNTLLTVAVGDGVTTLSV